MFHATRRRAHISTLFTKDTRVTIDELFTWRHARHARYHHHASADEHQTCPVYTQTRRFAHDVHAWRHTSYDNTTPRADASCAVITRARKRYVIFDMTFHAAPRRHEEDIHYLSAYHLLVFTPCKHCLLRARRARSYHHVLHYAEHATRRATIARRHHTHADRRISSPSIVHCARRCRSYHYENITRRRTYTMPPCRHTRFINAARRRPPSARGAKERPPTIRLMSDAVAPVCAMTRHFTTPPLFTRARASFTIRRTSTKSAIRRLMFGNAPIKDTFRCDYTKTREISRRRRCQRRPADARRQYDERHCARLTRPLCRRRATSAVTPFDDIIRATPRATAPPSQTRRRQRTTSNIFAHVATCSCRLPLSPLFHGNIVSFVATLVADARNTRHHDAVWFRHYRQHVLRAAPLSPRHRRTICRRLTIDFTAATRIRRLLLMRR